VKHAGPSTFARISLLLRELRARPQIEEKRPGVFYLKSRAFLHFHDDPSGIFADVLFTKDFVRVPVSSRSQQADLLEQIDGCLSEVESKPREKDRRASRRRGKSRPAKGRGPG